MAVSVRTLQNRLKEEGVVFSQLTKDIRERLAKKYLRENYSVDDITYLLGFSEPSVFRKAFKNWSEVTPREYCQMSLSAKVVKYGRFCLMSLQGVYDFLSFCMPRTKRTKGRKQTTLITATVSTPARSNGASVKTGCSKSTRIKPMNNMLAANSNPVLLA